MKNYLITAMLAGGMAFGTLVLPAVASAAPAGPSQVEETVRTLEASGYNVIINRTGSAELSSCSVTAVREGQTHSTIDSRGSGSPNETVMSRTVHVDVAC